MTVTTLGFLGISEEELRRGERDVHLVQEAVELRGRGGQLIRSRDPHRERQLRDRRGRWIDMPDLAAQQADFASIFDGFDHGGLSMRVKRSDEAIPGMLVTAEGDIRDADGSHAGSWIRQVVKRNGDAVVRNAALFLEPEYQGRGFAAALQRHAEAEYRRRGFGGVQVDTAAVGGYAWARAGFDFDDQRYRRDWQMLDLVGQRTQTDEHGLTLVNGPEWKQLLPPDARSTGERLEAAMLSDEGARMTVQDIAGWGRLTDSWVTEADLEVDEEITVPAGETMWPGKLFLLGTGWKGYKPLAQLQEALSAAVAGVAFDQVLDVDLPPDAPWGEQDRLYWRQVDRLAESDAATATDGPYNLLHDDGGDNLTEAAFSEREHPRDRLGKWIESLGLPALKVGGAVRDPLLGKTPNDIDYTIMGSPHQIAQAVRRAGGTANELKVRDRVVGIRAHREGVTPVDGVELAPPRTERSTGPGRHDFVIVPHPAVMPTVVAIDGPAAAGKSSVAKRAAKVLGGRYVDTGAMYRLAALAKLRGEDPLKALQDADVRGSHVFLHGEDVSDAIRTPEVEKIAPQMGADEPTRDAVNELVQRVVAKPGISVVDGRDAGRATNADLRLFLDAHPETRARRRALARGGSPEETLKAILARDAQDAPRIDPSRAEADHVVDTTHLSRDQVIDHVVQLAHTHQAAQGDALAADAVRRDFTVNALYQDQSGKVHDPTGRGLADVRARVLRTTHDTSFRDDPLRILRGLRFVSQHGLRPEPDTLRQMHAHAGSVTALTQKGTSGTVRKEFDKLLMGDHVGDALRLMRDTGVWGQLFPEMADTVGFDQQSPYHDLSLDDHIISVVENTASSGAPLEVRLAAFFHDSGKPSAAFSTEDGRLRYHGNPKLGKPDHADAGADIARTVMERLQYPTDTINRVERLVRHHMVKASGTERGSKARRWRQAVGPDLVDQLFQLRQADITAKGEADPAHVAQLARFRDLVAQQEGTPTAVGELAIGGRDLIAMGAKPGPAIGAILQDLLQLVVGDPGQNTREALLKRARSMLRAQGLLEADFTEGDHPRNRLGRFIEALGNLSDGEAVHAPLRGTAVRYEAGAPGEPGSYTVLNRGDWAMPVYTSSLKTAAHLAVGDQLDQPGDEAYHGTLLDPDEVQRMMEGFSFTMPDSEDQLRSAVVGIKITRNKDGAPTQLKANSILARVGPNGQAVHGTSEWTFTRRPDTFTAYFDTLIGSGLRGGGQAYARYMEDEFRHRKVTKVTLRAAMTSGGYVWAKSGYRFRRYEEAFDSPPPEQSDRAAAHGLFVSRFDDWMFNVPEDIDAGHFTWEDVRAFANRFPAVDMPEGFTDADEQWMPSDAVDLEGAWDREIVRGDGGPFFESPQDIAMWGVDSPWDDTRDGLPIKMWMGKQFLLGSKWDGEKTIPQVAQEAHADDLAELADQLDRSWPDPEDDLGFWSELKRRWALLEEAEYDPLAHPKNRLGRWIDTPDLLPTDALRQIVRGPQSPPVDSGVVDAVRSEYSRGYGQRVQSALEVMSSDQPPVSVGDDAGHDRALRDNGFIKVRVVPAVHVANQRADTHVEYQHPQSGSTLAVEKSSMGRVTRVRWRPGVMASRRAQELSAPPKSWDEWLADINAFANDLAGGYGRVPRLTTLGVGDELADSAGLHDWAGNARIGPDAYDDIVTWADGDRNEPDRYFNAHKVGTHEVVHTASLIDPVQYQLTEGHTLEEALVEELSGYHAPKRLEQRGDLEPVDWAFSHPRHERARGTYHAQRHSLAWLLNASYVAPESRRQVIEQLLGMTHGQRKDALAARLADAQGMGHADALATVESILDQPSVNLANHGSLAADWTRAVNYGDPPYDVNGRAVAPGALITVAGQPSQPPGTWEKAYVKSMRWLKLGQQDALELDLQHPTGISTRIITQERLPHMVNVIEEAGVAHLEDGNDVRRGDLVEYDRHDGGVSQAVVQRVIAQGSRERGEDFVIEAVATDQSLAPGEPVVLAPDRVAVRKVGAPSAPQGPSEQPVAFDTPDAPVSGSGVPASPRVGSMNARQLGSMLEDNGFRQVRQRGSHRLYAAPGGGRSVVVPDHGGRSLARGTQMSVLRKAGLMSPPVDESLIDLPVGRRRQVQDVLPKVEDVLGPLPSVVPVRAITTVDRLNARERQLWSMGGGADAWASVIQSLDGDGNPHLTMAFNPRQKAQGVVDLARRGIVARALMTAPGRIAHEAAHLWASAAGFDDFTPLGVIRMRDIATSAGVTPADARRLGAQATWSPSELWAEAVATVVTDQWPLGADTDFKTRIGAYVTQGAKAMREHVEGIPATPEAGAAVEQAAKVGYRHKDTVQSFWDRMEAVGHQRPPHLREAALTPEEELLEEWRLELMEAREAVNIRFDPAKHPKDRFGRFKDTLDRLPVPKALGGKFGVVHVEGTPHRVARTRKGFTVASTDSGSVHQFQTSEEAARHVTDHVAAQEQRDAAQRELEQARAETAAARAEREAASQRMREELASSLDHKYPRDAQGRRFYFRLEASADDARHIVESGEVWGQPRRNVYASDRPAAKAHMGRLPDQLPEGFTGVEFVTDTPPDEGLSPGSGEWSLHDRRGDGRGLRVEGGWAKLAIEVTRHTLSPAVASAS